MHYTFKPLLSTFFKQNKNLLITDSVEAIPINFNESYYLLSI